MRPFRRRLVTGRRVAGVLACLAAPHAAWGQTWDGGSPTNNNWSTGENWAPQPGGTAPTNDGNASLTFAGTVRLTPFIDAPWSINSLTFDATAGGFAISGSPLTLGAGGITHNDNSIQQLNPTQLRVGAAQTWRTSGSGLLILAGGSIDLAGDL